MYRDIFTSDQKYPNKRSRDDDQLIDDRIVKRVCLGVIESSPVANPNVPEGHETAVFFQLSYPEQIGMLDVQEMNNMDIEDLDYQSESYEMK